MDSRIESAVTPKELGQTLSATGQPEETGPDSQKAANAIAQTVVVAEIEGPAGIVAVATVVVPTVVVPTVVGLSVAIVVMRQQAILQLSYLLETVAVLRGHDWLGSKLADYHTRLFLL